VAAKGLLDTKEACWRYFVSKCRNNLHVVLCMSPIGETLRTRCRNFPGMVNNCVIDWFTPWPEEALHRCARAASRLRPLATAASTFLLGGEFDIDRDSG
jgi:hypothetical protein